MKYNKEMHRKCLKEYAVDFFFRYYAYFILVFLVKCTQWAKAKG